MSVGGAARQPWLEQYQTTLDPLYHIPPCQWQTALKAIQDIAAGHSSLGNNLRMSAGNLIEEYGLEKYLTLVADLDQVAGCNEGASYYFLAAAPAILDKYGPSGYHRLAESLVALCDTPAAAIEFLYHSPAFLPRRNRKYLEPFTKATARLVEHDPDAAQDLLGRSRLIMKKLRKKKRITADDIILEYVHDQRSAHLAACSLDLQVYGKKYADTVKRFY